MPTVGRVPELRQLTKLLQEERSVLLEGTAGVGKSHLARAALERLADEGTTIVEVLGGSASPQVPLGPFVHLVPVVPGEVPVAGLIAATLDGLRRRSEQQPLALLADDVDLFDEASAVLLAHVVTTGCAAVVATCRTTDALAGPVASLVGRRLVELRRVEPFDLTDVLALSKVVLGQELDNASGILVHKITAGNPLWVTELLRAASARRALTETPAGLALDEGVAMGGLDALLRARLSHLSEPERVAVELLAVAGALPVPLLEGLAGPPVVSGLAQRGLVIGSASSGDTNVRLVHPLYRHSVLAGLDPLLHRERLRQLIGAVQRSPDPSRTDLLRLALWHAELGEHFEPESLGVAARELHWGLLEQVRRHLAGRSEGDAADGGVAVGLASTEARAEAAHRVAAAAWAEERSFENGLALARALATYRPDLAREMLRVIEELDHLARSDEDRAWLAVYHAIWLFWTIGDRQAALDELDMVEGTLGPPWDIVARATHAGLRVQLGWIGEALRDLEAIELDEATPGVVRVTVDSPMAAALELAGRLDEGWRRAVDGAGVAIEWGDQATVSLMELLIQQRWGELCLRRYQEAMEGARGIADVLAETEDNELRAVFVAIEARAALLSGSPVTADEKISDAIRWHPALSTFGFRPLLHTTRALALLWSGRLEEARAECHEARRWHQPPRPFDADLGVAEAFVDAAAGQTSRAVERLTAARLDADARGIGYYALVAADATVRLDPTAEHLALLEAAAGAVDDECAGVTLIHGRALLHGDPLHMAKVAEDIAGRGERLRALELHEAAVARLGPDGSALSRGRLTAGLHQLRERCEGARSPFVPFAPEAARLTAREQEIATLAARGWSSPAMADELGISTRTVESHLYRAFAKLGVTSREELRAVLR